MTMWNWLLESYIDGEITLEDLEKCMIDDRTAMKMWEEWAFTSSDFIRIVRDEVGPFIEYLKKKDK